VRTFLRNRLATLGTLYLLVVSAAIVVRTPWLGLPDPNRINLARQFQPPSEPSTCSAPTRTVATCCRG
jgi:hypothetical protein